jgi:XTP/dITP diphosphohydrolase
VSKLVVATFNTDKLRELEQLLDLPGSVLLCLRDFPGAQAPLESGTTLTENALLKARAGLEATGLPTIADDTGLEVEALQGRPGVYAARFAGPRATYAENVQRLLESLREVEGDRRAARFRTVCVACFPDGGELIAEGVLEGRITERPRGDHGFGYDPVFEVAGLGRTLAEISPEEKNVLSHRARALRELKRQLSTLASAREAGEG